MLQTMWATVHGGQIQLNEQVALPEGTQLLVTVLPGATSMNEDEANFWRLASQASLAAVWDNAEDDAYGQLLEE